MNRAHALLKLSLMPKIGNKTIMKLLLKFPDLKQLFSLNPDELINIHKLSPAIAKTIADKNYDKTLTQELKLLDQNQVKLLTIIDDDYPANLRDIYDPPCILYYKGTLKHEVHKTISIVGSRNASYYGASATRKIIKELAELDSELTIISGLALGIDTIAHQASLANNLKTIAILGNGLASVYPRQNKKLADQILANGGLIISEFPLHAQPIPQNFPARNRIISGIAQSVLILQAGLKSGSLITARLAFEQNKDVFVLPSSIFSEAYFGSHRLIKNNVAQILTSGLDVLEALNLKFNLYNFKDNALANSPKTELDDKSTNVSNKFDKTKLSELEQTTINCLKDGALSIEQLAAKLNNSPAKIISTLSKLEMLGWIIASKSGVYELNDEVKLN